MALRGTAGQANTAAASSCVVTVSGIGIAAGDIILLLYASGGGGTLTLSFPSGFNAISGCADGACAASATSTTGVRYKVATGSEPTTYTCTSGVTDWMSLQCRVYSGRSATQFTATQETSGASAATPVTYAISGVTASSHDDVCVLIGGSPNNNSSGTSTYTPPTNFANGLETVSLTNQFSPILASSDDVNVSSGATGTLGGSMTFSTSQNYAYRAYLVSMASQTGGKLLLLNSSGAS
jgi:hypothetical protein